MYWLLDRVRAWQHESVSADIRRFECDPLESKGQRTGNFGAALERWFSLGRIFRDSAAVKRRPCPLHWQSGRRANEDAAPHVGRVERAESDAGGEDRRSGNARAY